MNSIQSRLALGLSISLFSFFLLLWVLVSYNIQELAEEYTASRLEHDIETLLSAISFDQNKKITIDQARINPIYQRPFSGHYFTISYQNKVLRSRSLWDQSIELQNNHIGKYTHEHQDGPQEQFLLIVSSDFNKSGKQFSISVAEDLNPLIVSIQHFKNIFFIVAFLTSGLLLIFQILIVRHGLRPLLAIKSELSALEQGQIDTLSKTVPNELSPVVYEINHLLEILNKRLKRSREALSDLSHSIKKPLTILHQLSEQKNNETLQKQLNIQVGNIQQLTDRILKRARLAGSIHSGSFFRIQEDLPPLLQTIDAMYPDKQIQVHTLITASEHLPMDREDMLELLGNLLDNAYKWAKAQIQLTVQMQQEITICIEDDGPGCNEEDLIQLAQRGVRLDESTHGYGFGLAICADIVNDYEGEISFQRSPKLAGFQVKIHFPRQHH